MRVNELSLADRLTVGLVPMTGVGLITLAYTSSVWLATDGAPTFAELADFIPDPGPVQNAALYDAYFSWLGWTLLCVAAAAAVAVVVGLLSRRTMAVTLLLCGLTGATLTLLALWFEGPRMFDVSHGRFAAVINSGAKGLWFAIAGYLIIAASGPVVLATPSVKTTGDSD